MATNPAVVLSEKRPNGRSSSLPPVVLWTRRALKVTHWVLPELSAELARLTFFRPLPPARLRPEEDAVLATGQRFEIHVDGLRVVGWSWGTGRPVLLSHGWAGHAGQMTALVGPLVEKGHQVVAVDMPAHGRSEGTSSTIPSFATTMQAVAGLFGGIDGLVAHSFGAGAALYAMARGLRVRRAVFFAPPSDFELFWQRFRETMELTSEQWQRMQRRSEAWLKVRFDEVLPRNNVRGLDADFLIFHDEADREIPFSSGEQLAQLCPRAELVKTAGLGHVRILKDPQVVARAASYLAVT